MDREMEDLDSFIDIEDGAEFPWPLFNKDKRLGMIKEAHRRWLAKQGKQAAPKPDRRAYWKAAYQKAKALRPAAVPKVQKPKLPSIKDDPKAYHRAVYERVKERRKTDPKVIAQRAAEYERRKARMAVDRKYRAKFAAASKRCRERKAAREAAAKEGATCQTA